MENVIDIKQFSSLQKASKESFFQQKKIIKKVLAGQAVLCEQCQQPLCFFTSDVKEAQGIRCQQGCTKIQLDIV